MPDICMCVSNECPRRNECYRWRVKPSEHRQSISRFYKNNEECSYFSLIGVDDGETIRAEDEVWWQVDGS